MARELVHQCRLSELAPGLNFLAARRIIAHRDGDKVRATFNRCRHQGGMFTKTSPCAVRCANHGWELNVATMTYDNPSGGLRQDELEVAVRGDEVAFFETPKAHPWDDRPRTRGELRAGELTVRFLAHACAELGLGGKRVVTDPWLTGPAFSRGWWLAHTPPADWLERLATADAIYISHNHTDHLNLHTLARLAAVNPDVPVYIPAFKSRSCELTMRKTKMRDVRPTEFHRWIDLSPDARMMLLPDESGRDDSGLLAEYKGHRILNTVDCANLGGGDLPESDVILTAFASGASGYPVCWEDLYSEEHIAKLVARNRHHMADSAVKNTVAARARVFVPFAGYFTEAHPSDADVKRRNVKNKPADICALVAKSCPGVVTWNPQAGEVLDVGLGRPVPGTGAAEPARPHDFEPYLAEIRADGDFGPLSTLEGVRRYFEWAGFRRPDLVLHVIETDERFAETRREFYVDFSDLSVTGTRPSRPHVYERMRVRSDVLRHVMRHGLPWEEISIGFQARFYREPDVYNFDFWSHFQNELPQTPPVWA